MKTLADIQHILNAIQYKNWSFDLEKLGTGFALQVQQKVNQLKQHSKKWYISPYASKEDILQMAFLSILVAEEKGAISRFRYNGKPIFVDEPSNGQSNLLENVLQQRKYELGITN